METPWGDLADLDPLDRDLAFKILSQDKHQLLEGLVVENTFDQIIRPLGVGNGPVLRPLDVDTVIAKGKESWLAFVWARSPSTTAGLGRYLTGLEKVADVYLVAIEAGTFVARRSSGGKRSKVAVPLHELLSGLTGKAPILPRVSRMVRDVERQQTAFWGFLNTTYPGKRLWNEVVLFRLLINCGIQSFFRGVWNLDRICLFQDQPGATGQLWMLEVKHKYPMKGTPLKFGINDGEIQMMKLAAQAGVRTMHGIIVKPIWDKAVGSMYLHSDLEMREKAAVIGAVLDLPRLEEISRGRGGTSASDTTITGSGSLSYKMLEAREFLYLGAFADGSQRLSASLGDLLSGKLFDAVSDDALRELSVIR